VRAESRHRGCVIRCTLLGLSALWTGMPAVAATPATYRVGASTQDGGYSATGTIQAVRQGTLAAQLAGRVVEVLVRSGDEIRAGQTLIRIEADDAVDTATATAATASGAMARLAAARADHERAQRLRAQDYISVAAMQRSEAALRSAEAEAQAAAATASGARSRAGWRTVTAPYAGHVTDLFVTAGDLATPGRPLLGLYDPAALRVIVQVPESVAAQLQGAGPASVAVESGQAHVQVTNWKVVSAVDPATHSVEVRIELPAGARQRPGQFVQVLLPLKAATAQLRIPARAVLQRSEVTAVYVIDAAGAARLRQVRLGPVAGDEVTVLAGLDVGELIALDPLAAGKR
jgi:RND family efflux transporter MFP subunit